MDSQKAADVLRPLIEKGNLFTLKSVDAVNHKPHPYVIGPKHIQYSSGVYLNVEEAERKGAKCYHKGCTMSYAEHTHDTVAFLQLTKNVAKEDAQKTLGSEDVAAAMKANGVDGVVFVDTDEKYRIV